MGEHTWTSMKGIPQHKPMGLNSAISTDITPAVRGCVLVAYEVIRLSRDVI